MRLRRRGRSAIAAESAFPGRTQVSARQRSGPSAATRSLAQWVGDRTKYRATVASVITTRSAEPVYVLLDLHRGTGTHNIVLVGGLDWGYDLGAVVSGYPFRGDRGNGIIHHSHHHPWKARSNYTATSFRGKMVNREPAGEVFEAEKVCQCSVSRASWCSWLRSPDPQSR